MLTVQIQILAFSWYTCNCTVLGSMSALTAVAAVRIEILHDCDRMNEVRMDDIRLLWINFFNISYYFNTAFLLPYIFGCGICGFSNYRVDWIGLEDWFY